MKLNKWDIRNIISLYQNKKQVTKISKKYKVSRKTIYDVLHKNNIIIQKKFAPKIETKCYSCGEAIIRSKCIFDKNKNNFCDTICLQAYQEAGASHLTPCPTGSVLDREIVSKMFNLKTHHVVVNKDGDKANHTPHNLAVFENIGQYIKYRLSALKQQITNPITAIFDGSVSQRRYGLYSTIA